MQEWHMSCAILGKGFLPWLLWPWFHLYGSWYNIKSDEQINLVKHDVVSCPYECGNAHKWY